MEGIQLPMSQGSMDDITQESGQSSQMEQTGESMSTQGQRAIYEKEAHIVVDFTHLSDDHKDVSHALLVENWFISTYIFTTKGVHGTCFPIASWVVQLLGYWSLVQRVRGSIPQSSRLSSWAFTYDTVASLVSSWSWARQSGFISFRCLWIQFCNNLGQRLCSYNCLQSAVAHQAIHPFKVGKLVPAIVESNNA